MSFEYSCTTCDLSNSINHREHGREDNIYLLSLVFGCCDLIHEKVLRILPGSSQPVCCVAANQKAHTS